MTDSPRRRAPPQRRPKPASEAGYARLAMIKGPERGTVFPVILKETLIGRIDSNHLVIDDRSVSRVHARILLEEDGVYLEDLGSRGGTLVNNVRIERARLRDGDVIHVGEVTLQFND